MFHHASPGTARDDQGCAQDVKMSLAPYPGAWYKYDAGKCDGK